MNTVKSRSISAKATDYLHETVQDADIIGVTWGTTMHAVALQAAAEARSGRRGRAVEGRRQSFACEHVCRRDRQSVCRGVPHDGEIFAAPVIFDTTELKEMVERDRHIQRIIQLGKQANIAMFTVGTVHEDALLFRLGYLSKEEQKAAAGSAPAIFAPGF